MTEFQLQIQIIEYLKWQLPRAVVLHIPNEGIRSRGQKIHLTKMGCVWGFPDIMVISDGKTCAIEVKTPDGRVTQRQAETMKALNDAGCPSVECRSIEDVKAHLRLAGMLTREAA